MIDIERQQRAVNSLADTDTVLVPSIDLLLWRTLACKAGLALLTSANANPVAADRQMVEQVRACLDTIVNGIANVVIAESEGLGALFDGDGEND